MKINIQDIYNKEVNTFVSGVHSSYPQFSMTIYDWMKSLSYKKNREAVDKIRSLVYNSNEYKEAKKELLHAVTISATFNINRNLQDIKKLNNLIVIDVDAKDNPDFTVEQLKNITANFPFVAITMKSASNKGIFNIIPYKEGLNYKEVYNALEAYYKEFRIKTDNNNKDETRLRFNTYDDRILVRNEIEVWEKTIPEDDNKPKRKHKTEEERNNRADINRETILLLGSCIMELVDNYNYSSSDYNSWLHDGFRLATLPYDIGLIFFKYISQHSDNYISDIDVENKFNECYNTTDNDLSCIGYYFNKLKEKIGDNWKEHLYIVYNIKERLNNKCSVH